MNWQGNKIALAASLSVIKHQIERHDSPPKVDKKFVEDYILKNAESNPETLQLDRSTHSELNKGSKRATTAAAGAEKNLFIQEQFSDSKTDKKQQHTSPKITKAKSGLNISATITR